ncbi:hypothetical protein GCM10020218_064460 [Dactylosporangium vinaceum]
MQGYDGQKQARARVDGGQAIIGSRHVLLFVVSFFFWAAASWLWMLSAQIAVLRFGASRGYRAAGPPPVDFDAMGGAVGWRRLRAGEAARRIFLMCVADSGAWGWGAAMD